MTSSDKDRVAYELSLLTSLGEEVDTLLEAFFRHPDAPRYLARTPRLGNDIPWVLVACDGDVSNATGLVVAGTWDGKGWDLDGGFTLFTCGGEARGEFLEVAGWAGRIRRLGTVPGAGPLRPDLIALQGELAEATFHWARRAGLVREWAAGASVRGDSAFPQTFVEMRFGPDCYRGLVIAGDRDRNDRWDYDRVVTLLLPGGATVDLDAAQADMVEELVDGGHADSSR